MYLQNDINSQGHIQWFFFRITNTRRNRLVRFSIKNFVRKTSCGYG